MRGRKLAAVFFIGLLFFSCQMPFLSPSGTDTVLAAPRKPRRPPPKPRQKPEPMNYERAVSIEDKEHERRVRLIYKHLKNHKPLREYELQKEMERHQKRLEEIEKKYGGR